MYDLPLPCSATPYLATLRNLTIHRLMAGLAALLVVTLAACSDGGGSPALDAGLDAGVDAGNSTPHFVGIDAANRLVRFDPSDLATLSFATPSGLEAAETLVAIDVRASNGKIYGLGSTSRLYVVDAVTGVCVQVGGQLAPTLTGPSFGMDVNPIVDRIRIQSEAEENLRLNPDTGAIAGTDTALTYAVGDAHVGVAPKIGGTAYTPASSANTSVLYAIDFGVDYLVTTSNANAGALTSVGPLGVNVTASLGFDIVREGTTDVAYAAMTPVGAAASTLYAIDLTTGAATARGVIGGAPLVALTIAP